MPAALAQTRVDTLSGTGVAGGSDTGTGRRPLGVHAAGRTTGVRGTCAAKLSNVLGSWQCTARHYRPVRSKHV